MKKLILMSFIACAFSLTAKADQTCREGQEEIFTSPSEGGEGTINEIYICKGGVFVPKFRKAPEYIHNPRNTCKEGSVERFSSSQGEYDVWEYFVCKGGRFVPMYRSEPEYIHNPRNTCKEGSTESFYETNSDGETMTLVRYVCRHGRFVRRSN